MLPNALHATTTAALLPAPSIADECRSGSGLFGLDDFPPYSVHPPVVSVISSLSDVGGLD